MKSKKGFELAWNYVIMFAIGIAVLIFFIIFYTNIGESIKQAISDFFARLFSF